MLLNFVLEPVGTKVSCNKISTDGYESTNLTSRDFNCRKKGFLTEHFIKPPVDVTFTFPCHINICCILLNPFVGQQSSSQLEVYCASRPVPKTKHGRRRAEESKQPWSFSEQLPMFYQVSRVNIPHQYRIGFHNSRFPPHLSGQQSNMMNSLPTTSLVEMRHSKGEILTAATDLTIRISRTKNGSTCALSNLEIWGCVSSHVNDILRKSIHDSYNASVHPIPIPKIGLPSTKDIKSETSDLNEGKREVTKKHIKDEIHIPEEFTDPLTCEIMTIPMLLPSGKNVDKSTLDKYFDSEASHGRKPRDPFTGVEFYGEVRPVPNGALKARIDKFLSDNSYDSSIASLPRTVKSGNSTGLQRKRRVDTTMEISSLIKKGKSITWAESETTSCKHDQNDIIVDKHMKHAIVTTTTCTAGTSSTLSSSSSQSSFVSPHDKKNDFSSNESCVSESIDKSVKNKMIETIDEGRTHESCLKNSLDYALSALLGSSSEKSNDKTVKLPISERIVSCFKCKVQLLENIVAYTIPCSHSVCRSCLLNYPVTDKSIQCLICQKTFIRSDAVRIHSMNK